MPTPKLDIDIETFCPLNVKEVGVYRYVEHPAFMILMAAWSNDDGETINMSVGERAIKRIPGLFDPSVLKVAHNAPFERVCFSRLAGMPTGTYIPSTEYLDTQALVAEAGLPQTLAKSAHELGGEEKSSAGTALINFFCKPNRKGRRNLPQDHPEKWEQFKEYCRQDVRALIDVRHRVRYWPNGAERDLYHTDQIINDRGWAIDLDLAARAVRAAAENEAANKREMIRLTDVANPGSVQQLAVWARDSGLRMPNWQAETVENMLAREDLTQTQRRVFELRQELALVASKKFTSALASVNEDGRLRGGFRFFGAHTGRWSGRGVQPHNMPRAAFVDDEGEWDWVGEAAAILDLAMGLGASDETLKKLVRAMFMVDGCVVDYSSIEARVISWFAPEEWALRAFRENRDIYVETAERMSTKTKKLTRAHGKVAVLALGFNGGVASLRNMGAEGTDAELQMLVYQWRDANPNIVQLWKTLDRAFWSGGPVGEHLRVEKDGKDRLLVLPSGRAIVYRKVQLARDAEGRPRLRFYSPQKGGMWVDTYGGRLAENATQATARDVQAEAIVRLVARGFEVVGHTHDEIITANTDKLGQIRRIMIQQPTWAPGLPINAEGFITTRYRKG